MTANGRWNAAMLVAIFALGVVLGYSTTADSLLVRGILALVYLAVGPGAAIVWLARINDRVMQASLIVPLSLAVDAMVATGLIYAGIWSPMLALGIVAAITLATALLGVREDSAVVPLVALTLLPPIVLLLGQV
jgi:hypothetical protein